MTPKSPVLIREQPFSGGWVAITRYTTKDGYVVAHADGKRDIEPEVAELLDKGQKLNGVLRALDVDFDGLLARLGLERKERS